MAGFPEHNEDARPLLPQGKPAMSPVFQSVRGLVAAACACAFSLHAAAATGSDAERANSAVLGAVHADAAYVLGGTGKGVTIALLDTGIFAAHPEFLLPDRLLPGYNAVDGTSNIVDMRGHGTHVAGLVAADRDGHGIFGVAYDARLLPIKIFTDQGAGSTTYADAGLRYAIGRATIVNMSFGTPGSYSPAATRDAVNAGLLLVAAAGNTGAANPEWPARFAREPWAHGQIIAVGAVDASNRIAAFSNRAGDAAPWFLVAPGVNIVSTWRDGGYAMLSGTSMATPLVSGAAALIKQLWPYLRADQVAAILFETATDLGAPGIDPVYGRGLLNIERALRPVGSVRVTGADGSGANVADTVVRPSSATSRLWTLAGSGALRIIALDDFNRGYTVDLGTAVSKPLPLSLEQVFGNLDRRIEIAENVLADGTRTSVAYETGKASPDRRRMTAFALATTAADGTEWQFGTGGTATRHFGAAALALGGLDRAGGLALPALANPYFMLVPNGAHAAVARTVGQTRLAVAFLGTGLNDLLASQYEPEALPMRKVALPRAGLALFELSHSFGKAAIALAVVRARESGGFLGAQSSGVLSFGPLVHTDAVQLSGALLAAPHLAFAGQLAFGVTPGSSSASRVVTDLSDTRSNAFSLALVASDGMTAGDRFSMALSQPLRAYSGRMVLDVISAIDDEGNEVRERRTFSMVPDARELTGEANYLLPLGRDASLAWVLTLRRHPNNLTDAATEKLLAVRYFRQF
jgi:hypothetical protein